MPRKIGLKKKPVKKNTKGRYERIAELRKQIAASLKREATKKPTEMKRGRKMKPAMVPVKKMPRNEFEALVRLRKVSAPSSKINICRAKPKRKRKKNWLILRRVFVATFRGTESEVQKELDGFAARYPKDDLFFEEVELKRPRSHRISARKQRRA